MSQLDEWEEEKIQRLREMGVRKEDGRARAGADEPAPKAEDDHASVAREDKPSPPPRKAPPRDDVKKPFTVKLSSIIAYQIAALIAMPLFFAGLVALTFKPETARYGAIFLALFTLYPISLTLEGWRWPGHRRVSVIKMIAGVVAGGALAVLLLGFAGLVARQEERAKAVDRQHIVSEKQLPLLGYEHEKQTAKYLKKVRGLRVPLHPSAGEDRDRFYGEYKRVFVEPLTEMGYEFDVTVGKATERYRVRQMHRRGSDDVEFLMFNAICFRERLLNDGLISPDTGNRLAEVGFLWTEGLLPEGSASAGNEFTRFEVYFCPVTDVNALFRKEARR